MSNENEQNAEKPDTEQNEDGPRNHGEIDGYVGFNYVNIVGKGCEGWLNLFFGDECVAMINTVDIADVMRKVIPEKKYLKTKPCVDNYEEPEQYET